MQKKPILFIKIFIVLVVVAVLGFYFFHQSKAFLLGPQIVVREPQNGQVLTRPLVSIKGSALNAAILRLNDRIILADSFGNFEENLLLARGYNIIEVSAEDKFGRTIDKKIEVVY